MNNRILLAMIVVLSAQQQALGKITGIVGAFGGVALSKGKDETKASVFSAIDASQLANKPIGKALRSLSGGSFWGSSAQEDGKNSFDSKARISGGVYGILEFVKKQRASIGLFAAVLHHQMKLEQKYDHHSTFLKHASPGVMVGPFVNFSLNKSFSAGIGVVAYWMQKKLSMQFKDLSQIKANLVATRTGVFRMNANPFIDEVSNKTYSAKTKFLKSVSPGIIGNFAYSFPNKIVLSGLIGYIFPTSHKLKDAKDAFSAERKVKSGSFLLGIGLAYRI